MVIPPRFSKGDKAKVLEFERGLGDDLFKVREQAKADLTKFAKSGQSDGWRVGLLEFLQERSEPGANLEVIRRFDEVKEHLLQALQPRIAELEPRVEQRRKIVIPPEHGDIREDIRYLCEVFVTKVYESV